jgi:hypothetical protein
MPLLLLLQVALDFSVIIHVFIMHKGEEINVSRP